MDNIKLYKKNTKPYHAKLCGYTFDYEKKIWICPWSDGSWKNEYMSFGKYRGKTLESVSEDLNYCEWLKNNFNFQNKNYDSSFSYMLFYGITTDNNIIINNDIESPINTSVNPLTIDEHYWLYEKKDLSAIHDGKWMLFYHKNIFNKYWQILRNLYNEEKLHGVVSMKCSTSKKNPRSLDNVKGIIILYCNNSDDEDYILDIGKNILSLIDYKEPYLYYKTNIQTQDGTSATGTTHNYTYKICNI